MATPGDYYEFTVDIINNGTIDAMINNIIMYPTLSTEQAKYLKYEVNYENGEIFTAHFDLAAFFDTIDHNTLTIPVMRKNNTQYGELLQNEECALEFNGILWFPSR